MNDDRLSQLLRQQADGIPLTPADPAGAKRRGTRRRTRRRVGLLGSVAVVGVLATSFAVRDPGRDQQVDLANGASASASTFDWSVVTPRSGLAWGGDTVLLADGSVYGISTAPGPYRPDEEQQFASTLYRSTDGAEWSPVSLPSGVHSSDLAGSGDTLYSVGTTPAGGIVLSSSSDGAGSWSSSDLPNEVVDLVARHPDRITLGQVELAAKDATHLVIGITASTSQDIGSYRPEYSGGRYMWEWDDVGVKVYELPEGECAGTTIITSADGDGGEEATRAVEELEGCRAGVDPSGDGRGELVDDLTYEELGITGELREHVGGVPYVYATTDGQTFQRVALPDTAGGPAEFMYVASPLAVADGYRLIVPAGNRTEVLRSTDGFTWEHDTTLPGGAGPAGVLDGQAVVSTWHDDGSNVLQIDGPQGWYALDLAAALGVPAGQGYAEQVSFGPLGFAALVSRFEDDQNPTYSVVHSTDGVNLQVHPLDRDALGGGYPAGVTVTADAIAVRIPGAPDGDDRTPPTQHVLVGTPPS